MRGLGCYPGHYYEIMVSGHYLIVSGHYYELMSHAYLYQEYWSTWTLLGNNVMVIP
jgi:hypothetical protein